MRVEQAQERPSVAPIPQHRAAQVERRETALLPELSTQITHLRAPQREPLSPPRLGLAPSTHLASGRADFSPHQPFSQSLEFPMRLLPEKFRDARPEDLVRAGPRSELARAVAKGTALLEAAVASKLSRLRLGVVENGATRLVPIFAHLQEIARRTDPAARVMPGAGVVRSAIASVLHDMSGARSHAAAARSLTNIAADVDPLVAHQLMGVGSDFDVYVQSHRFDEVRHSVLEAANSAESFYNARESTNEAKKNLFVVGDVKELAEQIERASAQGGSELDWLAFDVSAKKFVLPASHPHIASDLALGFYRYSSPRDRDAKASDKQTMRGLRPMLELPNLRLHDETVLRGELTALRGSELSADAVTQIDKMVRNSWWEGAHNRFYRAPAGSVEALAMAATRGADGHARIPEFLDHRPLEGRTAARRELNGLPRSALVDVDTFIRNHSEDGWLYHGSPRAQNALAVLRNGLFVSNERQGTAVYGRGAYLSKSFDVATEYADVGGLIFGFKLRADSRLNVIDWQEAEKNPAFARFTEVIASREKLLAVKEARAPRDVFSLLAEEHGVDVIINKHVILQNAAAVEFPKGMSAALNTVAYAASDSRKALAERIEAAVLYRNLTRYAAALGETNFTPFSEIEANVREQASAMTRDPLSTLASCVRAVNDYARLLEPDEGKATLADLYTQTQRAALSATAEPSPIQSRLNAGLQFVDLYRALVKRGVAVAPPHLDLSKMPSEILAELAQSRNLRSDIATIVKPYDNLCKSLRALGLEAPAAAALYRALLAQVDQDPQRFFSAGWGPVDLAEYGALLNGAEVAPTERDARMSQALATGRAAAALAIADETALRPWDRLNKLNNWMQLEAKAGPVPANVITKVGERFINDLRHAPLSEAGSIAAAYERVVWSVDHAHYAIDRRALQLTPRLASDAIYFSRVVDEVPRATVEELRTIVSDFERLVSAEEAFDPDHTSNAPLVQRAASAIVERLKNLLSDSSLSLQARTQVSGLRAGMQKTRYGDTDFWSKRHALFEAPKTP